jgi:hypothetical protein
LGALLDVLEGSDNRSRRGFSLHAIPLSGRNLVPVCIEARCLSVTSVTFGVQLKMFSALVALETVARLLLDTL